MRMSFEARRAANVTKLSAEGAAREAPMVSRLQRSIAS
jgi:hypothetical protein